MKTTHEVDAASFVRRLSVKTTAHAFFFAGALFAIAATAGCSDGAQPIAHQDCSALSANRTTSPSIRVSVKSNPGSKPDVSIAGNGFPAGAPISIGYFGLPKGGDATTELDLPARVVVNADGSFAVTQYGVYDTASCGDDSMGSTVAIAVGADGTIASTSAPARFWCSNATSIESYDSACQ
jgi:hypothetical protein